MTNNVQKTVVANKGEKTMKTEFNYFEYVKFNVLKTYFAKKFKGEDTNELTIEIKYSDCTKNQWFCKNGAFKFVGLTVEYDELGKQKTKMVIKDLNLDATATSKAGKQFRVFNSFDIAKATKSALKVA